MRIDTTLARLAVTVAIFCGATVAAADQDQPAPPPARPAAGAVDAARDYTRLMTSDRPTDAVRGYWDMDAMLSGIFGQHLGRQSDAERGEMRRLLVGFVETVYANPAIAATMKQAQFDDFKSTETKAAGVTAVTFNCRIQDKIIPNTLLMKQADGQWRIIDAGANGRMMVPAIRAEYEPQAQRVTPLEYIRKMVAPTPPNRSR